MQLSPELDLISVNPEAKTKLKSRSKTFMQIPNADNITRIKISISVGNTNVDHLRSWTALYNILSSKDFAILKKLRS